MPTSRRVDAATGVDCCSAKCFAVPAEHTLSAHAEPAISAEKRYVDQLQAVLGIDEALAAEVIAIKNRT